MIGGPATIPTWLGEVAARRGDAVALVGTDGTSLTYGALLASVRAASSVLREAGVGIGDPVLIAMADGPEALVAILAAASAGVAFPVSAHEHPDKYTTLIGDVSARAIVCDARLLGKLQPIATAHGVGLCTFAAGSPGVGPWLEIHRSAARQPAALRAPEISDPALFVATAGTTGRQKVVSMTHASVFASISHSAEWLSLNEEDRSLSVMPLSHLHGLFRSTLPGLMAGSSVVVASSSDRGEILKWIDTLRPTYMTASPNVYRTVLSHAAAARWSPDVLSLRFVGVGSDRIDAALVTEIGRALATSVRQFYALTEAAPMIAGSPPDCRVPSGAVGQVNPIWSVRTVDSNGRPLVPGCEGEIAVKGGFINPIVGRDAPAQRKTSDGYLLTGDLGRIDSDGFLFVSGRVDDRIHRGGEKIDPPAVEEVLLGHPAIAQAAAFGLPDPMLGQRVGAVIVPRAGAEVDAVELQAFAAARLLAYMVPERIVVADRIPVSATGKVSRGALAAALGLAPEVATDAEPAPPPLPVPHAVPALLDETERTLWGIFSQRLQRSDFGRDDGFFDLGGDSFGAIDILFAIEDAFGTSIPAATFIGNSSVAALAALLHAPEATDAGLRLVPVRAEGSYPPLFIPYGNEGQVGFSSALKDALGDEQPIYVFHAPRGAVAATERMEDKAAAMVALIVAQQPRGPYYLAGYSFGAHLALEMAQQLGERGESVAFLGVVEDNADLEKRHFAIEKRPPPDATSHAANMWAIRRYVPKPYAGRVTLFRASEPAEIYQSDPLAGWGDIAQGGVDVFDIPGDHETIVTSEGFTWGPLLSIALAKARHRAATQSRLERETPKPARRLPVRARHTVDARIACKAGDRKTEIAEYRRALALGDQPLWVHQNLGEALVEDGQVEAGIAQIERAIDADPWPLWRIVNLADMKIRLKRPEGIEDLYQRGRSLLADDTDVMRHFGHLCRLAGRMDEAERAIRAAIALDARRKFTHSYAGDLRGYLSDILAATDRVAEAIAPAKEASALNPRDPRKCLRVGRLLSRAGRSAEASDWYKKALALDPNLSEATTALAYLARGAA